MGVSGGEDDGGVALAGAVSNEAAATGTPPVETDESSDPAWQLRKYLLLLAILVATVTYVAGLDPPGGVWLETKDGHRTGNPILPATHRVRYTLFYYFNATAFAASLVVIILMLFMKEHAVLRAVRGVMVLDVLCLMVAYVAGSCRGLLTTVYASLLCAAVFAVVVLPTWLAKPAPPSDDDGDGDRDVVTGLRVKERRKVLMLLAIFVTTITYTAALNPPGGFWEHSEDEEGHAIASHRAGDPILLERHRLRFLSFLVCNTASFAASLVVITLLMSSRLWTNTKRLAGLYGAIAVALLGLMGAYAAGSCRETDTTVYVLCLVAAVLVYISVVAVIEIHTDNKQEDETGEQAEVVIVGVPVLYDDKEKAPDNPLDKARSLILLLATLAVTVTYQAGLDPPGGVWRDAGEGHAAGGLILLATHARRYRVFYYCNSAAFVASVVVVLMVQSSHRARVNQHALKAAVVLDLLGLMGAYATGSCRDVRTSVYVFALAGVIFVGVVIPAVIQRTPSSPPVLPENDDKQLEKRRKLLLLLAILAVTITYQAGLTPPGKFWLEQGDDAHRVGDPVLADNYPRRYKAFFYCNATSFMASIAVIVSLVSRRLPRATGSLYWWVLYFCLGTGLVGLMGAYASGTTRRVRTSAYVFALVGAVLLFAFLHVGVIHDKIEKWISDRWPSQLVTTRKHNPGAKYCEKYRVRKYVLLLGILAASVTYQAGLDPPGGVWPSDGDGHSAGDPVLHDGGNNRLRYHAFFYSNSTCFVASVVVVVMLLQGTLPKGSSPTPIKAMHTVVVLVLLGLLVAYAAGSSRDWGMCGYVLAMAGTVLAYVGIYVLLSSRDDAEPRIEGSAGNSGGQRCRRGPSQV
ncbi:unnamed protein product [Urochloa decumbens]|uniref:PGG domain-containing protein n=1 Tax=Urochloa decumbens TaxID=240449 RepID=A0ABC9DFQ5_9POAL